jgi:peptide/nickel transport system ATP-binding protein
MGGVIQTVVIAGLDPAIHPSSKESFPREMDPRVKPGGDGLEAEDKP